MTDKKPFINVGTALEQTIFNKGRYFIGMHHLPSGEEVYFKALVTQFEDQYSSEWNTETVFGRMDPIRGFRGTQRIISLGWDVVAADVEEAKYNMAQCSNLLSMLYPSYDGGTTQQTLPNAKAQVDQSTQQKILSSNAKQPFKDTNNAATIRSAPLFKLKFTNLIQDASFDQDEGNNVATGLIGTIDGLTYAPDLEQGFFDEKPGILYPQTIKLAFGFYVAHDHPLGWRDGAFRQQKYPYGEE
jgi:hypothetical protein